MIPSAIFTGSRARQARARAGIDIGLVPASAVGVSAVSIAISLVLVRMLHLASGEAIARTAHLGVLFGGFEASALAFGFDRPPLTTLLALPFGWSAAGREYGLSVALGTAAMSGASVIAASGIARWMKLGRRASILYVAAFALNPLLVLSGAAGAPDALYAMLLLVAFGQFARWLERESPGPVIKTGVALGVAFLLRPSVVWVATIVALAFAFATWRRRETDSSAGQRAEATVLTFAVPLLFVIGLWASMVWTASGELTAFSMRDSRLADVAAVDPGLARRLASEQGALAWLGQWMALLGAPSLVAIASLVVHAAMRRNAASGALALVLLSPAAAMAVSLLSGNDEPLVEHVFPFAVVPVFVVLAYRERRIAARADDVRYSRRWSLAGAGGVLLLAASLASAVAIPLLPSSDVPLNRVVSSALNGAPAPLPDEVARAAQWIDANVSRGELAAEQEQAAAIMVAVGRYDRFRTSSDSPAASKYDLAAATKYVLLSRPLVGAPPTSIEVAHPKLLDDGDKSFALVFAAGDVRIYENLGWAPPRGTRR